MDRTAYWMESAGKTVADFVADQRLILAGYNIQFVVDFNELHHFLHPFSSAMQSSSGAYYEALTSMLACAFLIYRSEGRQCLQPPLLVSPYVEELLGHLDYLRVESQRMSSERQRMVERAARLARNPLVRSLMSTANPFESEETREKTIRLLEDEFTDIARLAYVQEMNYAGVGRLVNLDLRKRFSHEFDPDFPELDRDRIDALTQELYGPLWDIRKERRDEARAAYGDMAVDSATLRDAAALATTIVLNKHHEDTGSRTIVLLLSSASVFHTFLRERYTDYYDVAEQCKVVRELSADERLRTDCLRSPFCLILFMFLWPDTSSADNDATRRKVLARAEEMQQEWALDAMPREIQDFYATHCSRSDPVSCEYAATCAAITSDMSTYAERLGSWSSLSLSLQRNRLLPETIRGEQFMSSVVADFLQLLLEPKTAKDLDDELIRLRRESEKSFRRVARESLMQRMTEAGVAALLREGTGRALAFPYWVSFEAPKIVSAVSQAREAASTYRARECAANERHCSAAFRNLASLCLDEDDSIPRIERTCLTASMLMLFDDVSVLESYVSSVGWSAGRNREWDHVRARSAWLTTRADGDASLREARQLLAMVSRRQDKWPEDVRIGNLKCIALDGVLRASMRRSASEEAGVNVDELTRELLRESRVVDELAWRKDSQTSPDLRCIIRANRIFYLTGLVEKGGDVSLIAEASQLEGSVRECETELPTRAKHSVAWARALALLANSDAAMEDARSVLDDLVFVRQETRMSRVAWTESELTRLNDQIAQMKKLVQHLD